MVDSLELKKEQLRLYEEKLRLKQGLPHLYGHKMYEWQHDYFNDYDHKHYFIVAANQLGKSTIQIRKRVHIATSPDLWPKLWPRVFAANPRTIPMSWYLYPNQTTAYDEFFEKWVKTILPSGEYKDHPIYGWKHVVKNKILHSVTFNTGYTIYFKTYNQSVHDLQAGTAFAIDTDEELPVALMPELQARLFGTDGQFSMAFTATMGQEEWRCAVEETGDKETYKDAWKRTISAYDCLKYHDGSETPWTEERIQQNINACTSEAEVKRRIFGRFVKDEGLKYPQFSRSKHIVSVPKGLHNIGYMPIPKGWLVYSGVDYGSGGAKNHPSAITFLAVSPKYDKIRLVACKRFDKIEMTQADLYREYVEMRGDVKPVKQFYDWAAKDFGTIAERAGDYFEKAEKSHEAGEGALRSALKSHVFKMYDSPEVDKLARELETLGDNEDKRKAKDDLIDSLRYAIVTIPVDWKKVLDIKGKLEQAKSKYENFSKTDRKYIEARPDSYMAMGYYEEEDSEEEIEFWDGLY